MLSTKIDHYLQGLKRDNLLRTRQPVMNTLSDILVFDSNDYLSLLSDQRVAEAYQHGFKLYHSGSGGSMLINGYHPVHQALEMAFADYLEVEECILVSSGYVANLAVSGLLGTLQSHCFIDKKIHASVYDGLKLAQISYTRYLHNDVLDLEHKLQNHFSDAAIITEGIFSMSGQIAPLNSLSTLSNTYKTILIVDEAHAIGVIGEQGKGATALFNLSQTQVPLRIIPLGKAFAGQGAIIAGKAEWIQALLQAGRPIIYSTAISPAMAYGLLKTLDVVVAVDDRRSKLKQLISLFQDLIKESPLRWVHSASAIQQLQLGCPLKANTYSLLLKEKGVRCTAIRQPTVSRKESGLRVVLNYQHQFEDLHYLFNCLKSIHENTHS